ncbi:hypothetical protein GMOD_00001510 [Pyrenophora seminiperda CCB06]|uniref:Uncharacterized protein n=1 Tax=Pyrenophora seminiperda CCB06 TaxID=1302712 RepID=A0A3M7LZ72_9PLEO|nr:hypothetical protein GMOD_00001510 [Pyrenophora seminiperda CCB06]
MTDQLDFSQFFNWDDIPNFALASELSGIPITTEQDAHATSLDDIGGTHTSTRKRKRKQKRPMDKNPTRKQKSPTIKRKLGCPIFEAGFLVQFSTPFTKTCNFKARMTAIPAEVTPKPLSIDVTPRSPSPTLSHHSTRFRMTSRSSQNNRNVFTHDDQLSTADVNLGDDERVEIDSTPTIRAVTAPIDPDLESCIRKETFLQTFPQTFSCNPWNRGAESRSESGSRACMRLSGDLDQPEQADHPEAIVLRHSSAISFLPVHVLDASKVPLQPLYQGTDRGEKFDLGEFLSRVGSSSHYDFPVLPMQRACGYFRFDHFNYLKGFSGKYKHR